MPNILEPYQEIFVNNILKAIDNNNAIIAQLSTGGGKTVVFASIVNNYIKITHKHKDVLIVVHRSELLNQTYKTLLTWHEIGSEKIDADNKSIRRRRVYIGMVETLKNRLKIPETLLLMESVGLVIIDEAHISNFKKIFPHFPNAKIIGFTATPIAATKKDPLNNYYDDIVVGCSITDLIELNQTVKNRGLVQNLTYSIKNINRDELKVIGGEFDEDFMGEKFSNKKQILNTIDAYNRYSVGKRAICFNANVAHSKKLTEEMIKAGLNARHLDGQHEAEYREKCLKWLREEPDAILCNVGIATTGFDEPKIETVIVNSAMKSLSYWLQKCGRGARPCTEINKNKFIILDLGGNALTHGDWCEERDWNDLFHNPYIPRNGKPPVRECPECGFINPAAARKCQECGFEFPLPSAEEDTTHREFTLVTKGANVVKIIEQFKNRREYDSFLAIIKELAKIIRQHNEGNYLDEIDLQLWLNILDNNIREWIAIKGKRNNESYYIDGKYKLLRELTKLELNINIENKHQMTFIEQIDIPGFDNFRYNANGEITDKTTFDIVDYIDGYVTLTDKDGSKMDFTKSEIEDIIANKLFSDREFQESKLKFTQEYNEGNINGLLATQLINIERNKWEVELEELEEQCKLAQAEMNHCKIDSLQEYALAWRMSKEKLESFKNIFNYGDIHLLLKEEDLKLEKQIEELQFKKNAVSHILKAINQKDYKTNSIKSHPNKREQKRQHDSTFKTNERHLNEHSVTHEILILERENLGIKAKGRKLKDGRFEVIEGSKIRVDIPDWYRKNKKNDLEMRWKYESDGTIVNSTFMKSVIFTSSSGAASFILGSRANGNKEWK